MGSKSKPTHYYSLAWCVHAIAYVITVLAAFTPYWSRVEEENGTGQEEYDRGIFLSCSVPGESPGCGLNGDITSKSGAYIAAFVLTVAAIVSGFLILQLCVAGGCVRSLKMRNLGLILAFFFILQLITLSLILLMFKISVRENPTNGYAYINHTFGLSQYMLAVALVLTFLCVIFAFVEHCKRRTYNFVHHYPPCDHKLFGRYRSHQPFHNRTYQTSSVGGSDVNLHSISNGYHHNQFHSNQAYDSNSNSNNNSNSNVNVNERRGDKRWMHGPYNNNDGTYNITSPFDFKRPNNKDKGSYATTSVVPLSGHSYHKGKY